MMIYVIDISYKADNAKDCTFPHREFDYIRIMNMENG